MLRQQRRVSWHFLLPARLASVPGKIFPSTGVALTPANFPNHSAKDVEDMFRIGKDLGDTAVFIYQWSQPDLQGTAQTMLKLSKQNNYTAILAISPTKLGGMRGEFDLPESVSRVVGRKVLFADKFACSVLWGWAEHPRLVACLGSLLCP